MKTMANLRASGRKRPESLRLESVKEDYASSASMMSGSSSTAATKKKTRSLSPIPLLIRSSISVTDSLSKSDCLKGKQRRHVVDDWHKEVLLAIQSGRWEHLKGSLGIYALTTTMEAADQSTAAERPKKKKSFWKRMQKPKEDPDAAASSSESLLVVDQEGRTPLHAALACRRAPLEVLLTLIRVEPRACQVLTNKQRYPLHFAILGRHHIQVIAELVNSFPEALSARDAKGLSPLAYAFDMAKKATTLERAPKTFWMTATDAAVDGPSMDGNSAHSNGSWNRSDARHHKPFANVNNYQLAWQEEQSKVWGIVHWLLLSLATNAQTHLVIGEHQKPMLVDALLHAAPPSVIALLIGASVRLLSIDNVNRANAFAGSTLYSCLARHYPLSILESLANQCPKDVRTVRDETGMGLVSAHFISGCFQQSRVGEWKVNTSFVETLMEATELQKLPTDNVGFCEWWTKMEYLILFCGCDEDDYELLSNSKEYLLHAALANPDVSPSVIRLLLALYPSSIHHAHPLSGALPIHIAASCPDYIPRNYEFQMMGSESTTLAVIVEADPSSIHEQQDGRLPLHFALDAGKHYRSLHVLLEGSNKKLRVQDPVSRLVPFMHTSSYQIHSHDEFRWSCLARNKYSHAVWKGLNEKQRSVAIQRVAEADELERTDSIYRLLRIAPSAMRRTSRDRFAFDHPGAIVRKHFLSWCFDENGYDAWIPNAARIRILERALHEAKETHSLDNLQIEKPHEFSRWWHKMKFWIRYCLSQDTLDAFRDIPLQDSADYLLHASLANAKNTPPQVIELLLALYPNSAQLLVPDRRLLPLHIACLAEPYIPLPFEKPWSSSIELLIKAYPAAVGISSENGKLPLHMAIETNKATMTLITLATQSPSALESLHAKTRLHPFQMVAMQSKPSPEQIQQLQDATGSFNHLTCEWDELPTVKRAVNVRKVQRNFDRMQLNCIFELMRKGASVIKLMVSTDDSRCTETAAVLGHTCDPMVVAKPDRSDVSGAVPEITVDGKFAKKSAESVSSQAGDSEDNDSGDDHDDDEEEEECETVYRDRLTAGAMPYASVSQPSSLMRLLSHESSKRKMQEGDDVFDCDHSVFSGVDVMSTISKSYHSKSKKSRSQHQARPTLRRMHQQDSDEASLQMSELVRSEVLLTNENVSDDESTVADDFATDAKSVSTWGEASRHHTDSSIAESSSEFLADSDSDMQGSDSEDSDFDGLIYFQMRRPKSNFCRTQSTDEPIKDVKLTKKDEPVRKIPDRAHSLPTDRMPSRTDSLRHMLISGNTISAQNLLENISELVEEKVNNHTDEAATVTPRKSKIYEQASVLRAHNASKDFDTEELLGKSFANMRIAVATQPKRAAKNATRKSSSDRSSATGGRFSSSVHRVSLESLLEPGQQGPSCLSSQSAQSSPQRSSQQANPNGVSTLFADGTDSNGSGSSAVTGSVSTIQLLENSRSTIDERKREVQKQAQSLAQPLHDASDSSSDNSVSDIMAYSVRSHLRGTGHGTEEGTDSLSKTEHTFSESAHSFFEESTSSDYNNNSNTEHLRASISEHPPEGDFSAPTTCETKFLVDASTDYGSSESAEKRASQVEAIVDAAFHSEDSLSGHDDQQAYFDKVAFKWVHPAATLVGRAPIAANVEYEERKAHSSVDDPELDECRNSYTMQSPLYELPKSASRDRETFTGFKSLKQTVGLPRAEKDSASWLREHMSSGKSGLYCMICNERRREVLMVPCHHLSLCIACSADNPGIPCPLCNIAVTSRIEIQL